MSKIFGMLGALLGMAGAGYIGAAGLYDLYNGSVRFGGEGNSRLVATYGAIFFAVFLLTGWLAWRRFWKAYTAIGLLCTLFSILGMFSIGPFLILGSLTVLAVGVTGVLNRR